MRGARFLLAVCATLALAGCVHEQYAQQASPRATSQAPPARHLYSTSPAYAQQAYEQPAYQMVEVQPARLTIAACSIQEPLRRFTPRRLPPPPPPAMGGPYVAAPSSYASAPAAVLMAAVSERPYTFDTGDKLRVVVFGQDGITNSYAVDAGGKVNLPLIAAVTARGLTNQQLADAITARLKQGFVREPHVSVEVETYRPFFILGEVTTPGQYPFRRQLDCGNRDCHCRRLCTACLQDNGGAHAQGWRSADPQPRAARLSGTTRRHHPRQGAVVLSRSLRSSPRKRGPSTRYSGFPLSRE